MTTDSLIPFPCDFTLKIMGKSQGNISDISHESCGEQSNSDFEKITVAIITKHFPDCDFSKIQRKYSKDNNYLSLSITVHAESKIQLDALYQELSSTKEVLMVL
ncbi:MAG: DUF493 domain-containing protein [Gammaproteobacteria bacterium]|nr:DUF493 domain-containing protein [Gammaproteobacteria bacterium]